MWQIARSADAIWAFTPENIGRKSGRVSPRRAGSRSAVSQTPVWTSTSPPSATEISRAFGGGGSAVGVRVGGESGSVGNGLTGVPVDVGPLDGTARIGLAFPHETSARVPATASTGARRLS